MIRSSVSRGFRIAVDVTGAGAGVVVVAVAIAVGGKALLFRPDWPGAAFLRD